MKNWKVLCLTLVLVGMLTGCSSRLPDVPDEEGIQETLPEELTTVTLGGEVQDVLVTSLTITERETDLTKQTDDVACDVTLTGDSFTLDYSCILHYAYVRDTGWTVRSWELEDDAELTLDAEAWLDEMQEENTSLLDESGYDNLELTNESWTLGENSYSQTFSVVEESSFLTAQSSVTIVGTLENYGSVFSYEWISETEEGEETLSVNLEGTIWHLLVEDENLEIVFQVDEVEGDTLVISGLIRTENWRGAVRESEMGPKEVTWTSTEHDSIVIPLTSVDGEEVSVYIQEEDQWATLGELYLGRLEQVSMPASGDLSDLMELDLSDGLWELVIPSASDDTDEEEPEEEEPEEEEETPEDSSQVEEKESEPEISDEEEDEVDLSEELSEGLEELGDSLEELWDKAQGFWDELWED